MSNTVNCIGCGKEVADRDSVDADVFTNDGGCFCFDCYKLQVEQDLRIQERING